MPIYRINNQNVLFIHVPKTGGTSIEAFLGEHAQPAMHSQGRKLLRPFRQASLVPALAMQHFHAELLRGMFPDGYFDYAFMVVRHPLRRLVSEYGHARQLARPGSWLPFGTWSAMMLRLAAFCPNFSNNHFRPQHEFHCFDAEVFKFEDGIESVLQKVAQRIGLPAPGAVYHKRSSMMNVHHVSRERRASIQKRYALDYMSFGYLPEMPVPGNPKKERFVISGVAR